TGVKDRANTRGAPVASTDTIQIVEPDGEIIWELSSGQFPDTLFHHDVEYLDNGHLLVTTYRRLDAEAALARGWDPEGRGEVWADGVLEIRPDLASGEATVVWAWSFADHLIQDRFPEKPNFGVIADHPDRIDPHYPDSYAPMNVVRQHVNSVDYHEALDQILLSSFIYNEIWIIDRSGRIVFRWGNPAAYQRGSPEDRVLLRQHDANWIDAGLRGAGNILIHNNNVQFRPRPPSDREPDNGQPRTFMDNLEVDAGVSGVYELRVAPAPDGSYGDRPGSPFAAEVVWRWEHESYFADFQGSARRLSNGNTLMTDTTDHLAVEVTRDGVIVAEYQGCAPAYKTYKYDRDFVARVINADHEEPR
ncbi:MAG: arylsulfotransferase family protein, partial [Pseudomonadota bacterium]